MWPVVCQLCREGPSLFPTASFFWTKVIQAGLPSKAFPRKPAEVDLFRVFRWLHKQRARFVPGQPKGCFQIGIYKKRPYSSSHFQNVIWRYQKCRVAPTTCKAIHIPATDFPNRASGAQVCPSASARGPIPIRSRWRRLGVPPSH